MLTGKTVTENHDGTGRLPAQSIHAKLPEMYPIPNFTVADIYGQCFFSWCGPKLQKYLIMFIRRNLRYNMSNSALDTEDYQKFINLLAL